MTIQTTPLTYNLYVSQVATLAVLQTTTTNGVVVGVDDTFNTLIPQMLSYSELRIQRDCDLNSLQTSGSYSTAANTATLSIPVEDFVTVQTLSIDGVPLTATSKEWIQNVYGSTASAAQPLYFAPYGGDSATAGKTSTKLLLGPTPNTVYPVAVTGTIRMPTLYKYATQADAATGVTFISTWLPDLLIQASLIYIAQFQRQFGAASNDPNMGPTYELQYENLLKGAIVEEARKKFQASAWSAMSPPLVASPNR